MALVASGCDNKTGNNQNTSEAGAATDSTQALAYVCPMKCEGSGSNNPGKCKVCDMDLVKNPNHPEHAAADSTARQPE